MQQLVYFLRKYRFFLFFLCLETIAMGLIINNHSFHRSKFVSSANSIVGGFYHNSSAISDYFQLAEENKRLVAENNELINQNEQLLKIIDSSKTFLSKDTLKYHQQYKYISGRIQKNQYSSINNFLNINLGKSDHISKDYNIVQLEGLPRQAKVEKGDTIITSGNSAIFPEGILIGTAINVIGTQTSVNKVVNIQLFNNMSDLKNIYVITNFDKIEIRNIELNADE